MVKQSVVLFSLVLLLAAPSVFSQIEERVNVGIIEIWVKVTDKDSQLVKDLRPQDFTILIDGRKADMSCFDRTFDRSEAVMPAESPDQEPSRTSREKRTFIFFFDLLHSSARDMDFLKKKMIEFLNSSFQEDDQGIIFALLPSVNLGIAQKLTSSKEALVSVVSKMRGNPTLEQRVSNNEKELMNLLYAFGQLRQNNVGGGAIAGDPRSPETLLQARGLARTFAAQERNLSKITMNSFLTIGNYLVDSDYTGRPVMIYVSGGFSLRPGQNYYEMVRKAIEDADTRGTENMAYWEFPPDNDFSSEVKNAIGRLNRLNITIYSIDANGLKVYNRGPELDGQQALVSPDPVEVRAELQDSLDMVSRETGGLAFLNSQNYAKGLNEIAADMGQQYWLCASLPPGGKRGSYHKIEVKVDREDTSVRHRQGYVD